MFDLRARLDELPSDLEQLFHKQLERSAQFFQMMRLACRQIPTLEFFFADGKSAEVIYNMAIGPLPIHVVWARVDIIRRRLNECCKGLIEVSASGTKQKTKKDS